MIATTLGGGLGDALAEMVSWLRVPVLVAAVTILVLCAFELGRYLAELWRRGRRAPAAELPRLVAAAAAEPGNAALYAYRAPSGFAEAAVLALAASLAGGRAAGTEDALADYELAVQRRLDRTRILVRAGPAIGLMGTLIPLAPGLAALGAGDVALLAEDLREAFAATVVGLLVGTVAFALTLSRTRMYTEDLTALERAGRVVP
jgi:biopolymer transport protein ExbB/TolQ